MTKKNEKRSFVMYDSFLEAAKHLNDALMSDYLGLILAVPLPEVSSWENPSAFLSLGFLVLGMRMRAAPAS